MEQARRGILENVGQKIESASMRHGCTGESGEKIVLGIRIRIQTKDNMLDAR